MDDDIPGISLGLRCPIEDVLESQGLGEDWKGLKTKPGEFQGFMGAQRGAERNESRLWDGLAPPVHSILVMVVGTRGDVDPLISLSVQLKESKHRVLFATHAAYREDVVIQGLDFFPLAGDPEILSGFAVKWSNSSTTIRESYEILQTHAEGVRELLHSTWTVICDTNFIPDCVISNPVTFTHAHIAESCGASLHIAFPQPWVPTVSFPHPIFASRAYTHQFANIYDEKKTNALTHQLADRMLYLGTEASLNELRGLMNLKPASVGEGHWKVLPTKRVPFSLLLSDSLLSRPADWGEHVKICGSVTGQVKTGTGNESTEGFPALLETFLDSGSSPVYIGFGSMVFDEITSLERIIGNLLEAAAINNVRVLVQLQCWSIITEEHFKSLAARASKTAHMINQTDQRILSNQVWFDFIVQRAMQALSSFPFESVTPAEEVFPCLPEHRQQWTADDAALLIGGCSHGELFQRVVAVVHHGGAGTTFEGLRHGLPTWVLPFFGDQRMWGEAIHLRGAGPPPVAPCDVTMSISADAFSTLLSGECLHAAIALKASLKDENGAKEAASHVLDSLPLNTSLCTLSLLVGEVRLAEVHCPICDLNMTCEAFERSHEHNQELLWHTPSPVTFVDWSPQNPKTVVKGLNDGVVGLLRCLVGGIYDTLASPTIGAMEDGLYGAVKGMMKGCSSLIGSTQEGGAVLASKLQMGAMSGQHKLRFCFPYNGGEGAKMKFHQVMGATCCEEQKEGRIFSQEGGPQDLSTEHALEERTRDFKTALQVAEALQSFMTSVRSRDHVATSDPIFDYCLHSDELAAELALLSTSSSHISSLTADSWSLFSDPISGECSPCVVSSSSSESSISVEPLFVPKSKGKIYLNDLALFFKRAPSTT